MLRTNLQSISSSSEKTASRLNRLPPVTDDSDGRDDEILAPPRTRSINKTYHERVMQLYLDTCTEAVGPKEVRCSGCHKIRLLDQREGQDYYPGPFIVHKQRCKGLSSIPWRFRSGMPELKVRREELEKDPNKYIGPLSVKKPYLPPGFKDLDDNLDSRAVLEPHQPTLSATSYSPLLVHASTEVSVSVQSRPVKSLSKRVVGNDFTVTPYPLSQQREEIPREMSLAQAVHHRMCEMREERYIGWEGSIAQKVHECNGLVGFQRCYGRKAVENLNNRSS